MYLSSDSASECSETNEDRDTSDQPPPSRGVAVNQAKQFSLKYELTLNPLNTGNIRKLNNLLENKDGENVSSIYYKPRSGRLRPYPYIASTDFDQPSGNHDEVMPFSEIEKKLYSKFSGKNTGLICLEEHAYIEFKPAHWRFERKSEFQHEPTCLGDLGPRFGKKVATSETDTTNTTAKKKKGEKDKNKSKGEQSTDTLEEIDEKSRQIYLLCDSMPNIMPPIRCFECKDWIKSSSFPRHVFEHIIQNKLAFPHDDKHNWCAHCNRFFENDLKLRDHYMMIKRFGRYFCMFCIKMFKNTAERFEHFQTHHFCQNTPYVCPVCPYKSSLEVNFTSHYVDSHPLPICHLCHHLFPNAQGLFFSNYRTSFERQRDGYHLYREIINHMKQHVIFGELFACNMCTLTFVSPSDLISHQKATHTNIALNVKKVPLSHTGFGYRDFVVSGEALSQLEFYKNEEKLRKLLTPYKRNVIMASTTARSHFQHASRKNGRRTENVEGSNLPDEEEEGILPRQITNGNQESFKFKDCFFDTKTAVKCLQKYNLSAEAFYEKVKCESCQQYVNPSSSDIAESAHFSKETIKCDSRNCTVATYCHHFMKLHNSFHTRSQADLGTLIILPEQTPTKEDLLVCSNCEISFRTYLKQNSHMKKRAHIGWFHSFKRDASDEKSQRRNKINWKEEMSKIQRHLND